MVKQNYFVHESSYIDDQVQIGEGTRIWHFCHVLTGSSIGNNCIIGQNCMIGPNVAVGNRCKLQNNVSLYPGVTLQDEVFCGPSCVFTNVYNPRAFIERKHEFRQTLVRRGAAIGANATIVCGTTVGRYALIAAGAVIKKDVPDYAVMAGVPARQVGWACKCGTTLKLRIANCELRIDDSISNNEEQGQIKATECDYCGNKYRLEGKDLLAVREVESYSKSKFRNPKSSGPIAE